jgi:soluble lytic murein transglycosylase-like protein
MAFAQVQKKERRKARLVLASVGLLLMISASYGIYQRQRVRAIERQASEFFQLMKSYEVQLVALRQQLEESGSPALAQQLTALDSARRNAMESYEAFVRERGLYRRLRTQEERLIYETARVFGESEFEISNSFIQAVLAEIRDYWLSGSGSGRLLGALRRAEENGYTGRIVETLTSRGVPPEFFYLALQESEFNARAVGPETRWGRAKGMWQFIPATAERYGLRVGSRTNTAEADPNDERLDFALATDAAARYLRDLHGVLTQASGLLVMAAYNWGEHRVLPRLEDLPEPQEVFREEFAGVPTNPGARNYWTFLTQYGDRMPEETKQYVIRIFAAAVIGRDPGYFGLNVENPLGRYVN